MVLDVVDAVGTPSFIGGCACSGAKSSGVKCMISIAATNIFSWSTAACAINSIAINTLGSAHRLRPFITSVDP